MKPLLLLVLLSLIACDKIAKPKLLEVTSVENFYLKHCMPEHLESCGPDSEVMMMMRLASEFASNSTCKGIRVATLTKAEEKIPLKDLGDWLNVYYEKPGE